VLRSQARFAQGIATKDLSSCSLRASESRILRNLRMTRNSKRDNDVPVIPHGVGLANVAGCSRAGGRTANSANEGPLWGKCCPQVADATSGAAASAASSVEDWLS